MNPSARQYSEEFARVATSLPGASAAWLRNHRKQALERFTETGFPTTRQEDWKYTDVTPIAKREFRVDTSPKQELDASQLASVQFRGLASHEMVFVNGRFVEAFSDLGHLPAGVKLQDIGAVLAESPDVLGDHFNRSINRQGFSALNNAFMYDGAVIEIAADTLVEQPIHLLFITNGEALVCHPRIIVNAGANSQAKVIETYVTQGKLQHFTNAVTEVIAADNSVVEHCKVQDEGVKSYHVANLYIQQQRDSQVLSHSVSFGAALARNDIFVDLDAEGAEVTLNGLYMADGRQHVDYHTRINHNKPHTCSEEVYKGVLNGAARGVFNGKVVVQKGAQKTTAHQSNKNLLLSKHAEADTKPELQIYADDVVCTHGATVGQLDEDALFYLRSRGIGLDAARELLIYAFADDVIARIAIAPIRERLEQALLGHLPAPDLISDFV